MISDCVALWAPSPTTTRAITVKIAIDPAGQKIAYASGRSIYVRDIDKPYSRCIQFNGHRSLTTVAIFSPNGKQIASGDAQGNCCIWEPCDEKNRQILETKLEIKAISGRISDIAWDADSAHLIAVGEGKNQFGYCFKSDSGNTIGEISGHSAIVNSISIRKCEPLRAVTASDDGTIVFHKGLPFKFEKIIRSHTNFVQDVQFSPDGKYFVSVGSDSKIFLYEAGTGNETCQIRSDESHKGSIFAVCWSPDSNFFATASADCTVKIWSLVKRSLIRTIVFSEASSQADSQQVGIVWARDDLIISLSYKGDLSYIKLPNSVPYQVLEGHQRAITSLAIDSKHEYAFTASYDGRMICWNLADGIGTSISGLTHTNSITSMTAYQNKILSVAMDDTLRISDLKTKRIEEMKVTFNSQPIGVETLDKDLVAIITVSEIHIFQKMCHFYTAKPNYVPSAIAVNPQSREFAVGSENNRVYVHKYDNGILETAQLSQNLAAITSMKFSYDGEYLAVGDASGHIIIYETKSWIKIKNRTSSHSGRVSAIHWNYDSSCIASASLDTNIQFNSIAKMNSNKNAIMNAHLNGCSGVLWLDNERIISCGTDACIKVWKVIFV